MEKLSKFKKLGAAIPAIKMPVRRMAVSDHIIILAIADRFMNDIPFFSRWAAFRIQQAAKRQTADGYFFKSKQALTMLCTAPLMGKMSQVMYQAPVLKLITK